MISYKISSLASHLVPTTPTIATATAAAAILLVFLLLILLALLLIFTGTHYNWPPPRPRPHHLRPPVDSSSPVVAALHAAVVILVHRIIRAARITSSAQRVSAPRRPRRSSGLPKRRGLRVPEQLEHLRGAVRV